MEPKTYLRHTIKLKPNKLAEEYYYKACGVSRVAYNWAHKRNTEVYQTENRFIRDNELVNEFNALRKEEYPWTYDVTKWACQGAINNYCDARHRFFTGISKYPKLKRRGHCPFSFHLGIDNGKLITGDKIKIPNFGWVSMYESVRFPGIVRGATIIRKADGWYASVLVMVDPEWKYKHKCNQVKSIGIDFGLNTYITTSDGGKIDNPRWYRKEEEKLSRLQAEASAKEKGSKNQRKAYDKVAKLYQKITRRKLHFGHNLTSTFVRENYFIGIEDLSLEGFAKQHNKAKSFADAAFGEVVRQFEYKAPLAGSVVQKVGRFFPSTKTCSTCNQVRDAVPLVVREWSCTNCGAVHDRDENAAKNILVEAAREYQEAQNDCPDKPSGKNRVPV